MTNCAGDGKQGPHKETGWLKIANSPYTKWEM